MLILALEFGLAHCSAGLVADGAAARRASKQAGRGQAALLPVMVRGGAG